MNDVISFAEHRAHAEGNSALWSPLDCLKALVRDIEAGKLNPDLIYIAMRETHPDDPRKVRYPSGTAGGGRLETAGLLSRHMFDTWVPRDG